MKLKSSSFNKVKVGQKTIELRLFDEKRQLIKLGDTIEFSEIENPNNRLYVKVVGLSKFQSFEILLSHLDLISCGWNKITKISKMAKEMRQYYSEKDEQKYGVIGIHIELVK